MSDDTHDTEKGKVASLKEERAKRQKPAKRSKGQLYHDIASAICRETRSIMPDYPHQYVYRQCPSGERECFRVDGDQVLIPLYKPAFAAEIEHYCSEVARNNDISDLLLTPQDVDNVIRTAQHNIKEVLDEDIFIVRWANDPGYCYHRLPWDRKPNHSGSGMPNWESVLARMSQPDAVIAWFGTIMSPVVKNHQYLWVYGSGNEGKSRIVYVLSKTFGQVLGSDNSFGNNDNRFHTSTLRKKRLVIHPDESDSAFIKSGTFRQITGGDPVRMERKGKGTWTERLRCRMLFMSNDQPEIDHTRGTQRRMIYSTLDPFNEPEDPFFSDKLYEEMGEFLNFATTRFETDCPHGGRIGTDMAVTEAMKQQSNQQYYDIFNINFVADPKGAVSQSDMATLLKIAFNNSQKEYRAFLKWLKCEHGCRVNVSRRFGDEIKKVTDRISQVQYVGSSPLSIWHTRDVEAAKTHVF